jgi:hypothetical protein
LNVFYSNFHLSKQWISTFVQNLILRVSSRLAYYTLVCKLGLSKTEESNDCLLLCRYPLLCSHHTSRNNTSTSSSMAIAERIMSRQMAALQTVVGATVNLRGTLPQHLLVGIHVANLRRRVKSIAH